MHGVLDSVPHDDFRERVLDGRLIHLSSHDLDLRNIRYPERSCPLGHNVALDKIRDDGSVLRGDGCRASGSVSHRDPSAA